MCRFRNEFSRSNNSSRKKSTTIILIILSTLLLVGANDSSSCNVERDDIRFFGSGGDAGRVELCYESTWRYVCSTTQTWDLQMANVACRQLGYESAFMADSANNMAFGETVDSGVDPKSPGILVQQCKGNERTLRNCQLSASTSCNIQKAVAAACSTAMSNTAESTYPVTIKDQVQSHMMEMASWYATEVDKKLNQTAAIAGECINGESKSFPNPFHDVQGIQEAFQFPNAVQDIYKTIETNLNKSLVQHAEAQEQIMELVGGDDKKIHWNAVGMDLSNYFHSQMTLDNVKTKLNQSPTLEALRDLYLSSNRHNAIHWFLDSPYRYYKPKLESGAQKLFEELQRNGMVFIDDFGADMDTVVQQAQAALNGEALYRKNETSIAGGGAIVTSRKPIPLLEQVLIYNKTLTSVINAYLGPSILHGYKVTHLTKGLNTTGQYNAGMYHHDRVGRRLKLFMFLHDVDCEMGHPTRVAAGTHNLLFYKSEDYPVTRFRDEFVHGNYQILKGCGKRGGGFLFDTHTLHKGTVEGDRERTVVIAEYHHIAKCAYSKQYNLGIPCPGGDLYRTDTVL